MDDITIYQPYLYALFIVVAMIIFQSTVYIVKRRKAEDIRGFEKIYHKTIPYRGTWKDGVLVFMAMPLAAYAVMWLAQLFSQDVRVFAHMFIIGMSLLLFAQALGLLVAVFVLYKRGATVLDVNMNVNKVTLFFSLIVITGVFNIDGTYFAIGLFIIMLSLINLYRLRKAKRELSMRNQGEQEHSSEKVDTTSERTVDVIDGQTEQRSINDETEESFHSDDIVYESQAQGVEEKPQEDGFYEGNQNKKMEKVLAAISHALIFVPAPLLNIVITFVYWTIVREKSSYVDHHGKQSLNFQVSFTLYGLITVLVLFVLQYLSNGSFNGGEELISKLTTIGAFFIGFALLITSGLFFFVTAIVALIMALSNKWFRYPLTISFWK